MTAKVVNLRSGDRYDIYIGRGSKFGNPFSHREGTLAECVVDTREEAIQCFETWLRGQPQLMEAVRTELKGKTLGCFCKPLDCHGDVLLKIANEEPNPTTDQ